MAGLGVVLLLVAIGGLVVMWMKSRTVPEGFLAIWRDGRVQGEGETYWQPWNTHDLKFYDPVLVSVAPRIGTYTFSFLVPENEISLTTHLTWTVDRQSAGKFPVTFDHQIIAKVPAPEHRQKARQAEDEALIAALRADLTDMFADAGEDEDWPDILDGLSKSDPAAPAEFQKAINKADLSIIGCKITRAVVTEVKLLRPVPRPASTPRSRILERVEQYLQRRRTEVDLREFEQQLLREFPEHSEFISGVVETERLRILGA